MLSGLPAMQGVYGGKRLLAEHLVSSRMAGWIWRGSRLGFPSCAPWRGRTQTPEARENSLHVPGISGEWGDENAWAILSGRSMFMKRGI